MAMSPGAKFRRAVVTEKPLQVVGAINAYCAILAEATGFHALYVSGAGVANASYGLPDLGITERADVLTDVRRITSITNLPILVDIDTGWGGAFNIAKTIREMIKAGVAAVHMEDQIQAKRCGHRPNKAVVAVTEMTDRIKAAVDARTDEQFVIMARTDALATEGLPATIERIQQYIAAGADMIFAEAFIELEQYQQLSSAINVPILANMTEFGLTPLFTPQELHDAGVSLVLYPLSAFRAMSAAALNVYQVIRKEGTTQSLLSSMQSRQDLYHYLHYHDYEKKLDELFGKEP